MKLTLSVLLLAITPAMVSADVSGVWRTERSKKGGFMDIQFFQCGSETCGKVKTAYRKTGAVNPDFPGVGQTLIKGMASSDGKNFKGGTLKNPENGKVYYSKMSVSGNNMKVSGCIAGGLLCNSMTLTKR